jgi:hypothetical protein
MALRQLMAENILASGKRLGPADISHKLRDGRPARPTRRVLPAPRSSVASTADRAKARHAAFHRIAANPEAESPSSIASAKGAAARGPAIQNAAKKPFALSS